MKKGLILFAAMLLLAGCGKEDAVTKSNDKDVNAGQEQNTTDGEKDDTATPTEGFEFIFENVTVPLNVDAAPIIEALGEPDQYSETTSCAFPGLDKYFTYQSFEISTYPQEDKDFIYTIYFLDDSVATDKGIYIGASRDEVVAAYGDDYTEESGELTYTLGETKLSFIIADDSVESITYTAIVEGIND